MAPAKAGSFKPVRKPKPAATAPAETLSATNNVRQGVYLLLSVARIGPTNSVRVAIAGTAGGINWANVFWCQLATGSSITQADLNTWVANFASAYKTAFQAQVGSTVNYATAQATLFTSPTTVLQATAAMTGSGSGSATVVNDQSACAVLSWLTAAYWRGGKPRTYFPGVQQSAVTGNNALTGTYQTALAAAGAGFITAVNALTVGTITGTQLGLVSFISKGIARNPGVFFAFTGEKVHPRLGSQRRRLGKWKP